MHPINKKHFGSATGKIAVNYHNGTSAVTGYIVKQTGAKRFVVTTNGTDTFIVQLAQTTGAATTLTAGFCTIVVTPFGGSAENVKSIHGTTCTTTQGNRYKWKRAGAISGEATLTVV